jgi:hypothetical protein
VRQREGAIAAAVLLADLAHSSRFFEQYPGPGMRVADLDPNPGALDQVPSQRGGEVELTARAGVTAARGGINGEAVTTNELATPGTSGDGVVAAVNEEQDAFAKRQHAALTLDGRSVSSRMSGGQSVVPRTIVQTGGPGPRWHPGE